MLICHYYVQYYCRNCKDAPINVQRGQVSPLLHPMASTYERKMLCTHMAFADHDNLANGPACKRQLLFYALEQKKKIMHGAFSQPHHIQLNAQKWRVQPVQICRWRAQVQADAVLPVYPNPCTVEERTTIKD
jgi:hypothetical protein